MPALPCDRTLPVGAGRPTARSIPSLLPPINGINDGRNSISHAGSGSCPKPDLRPHRPSFITDAAPDKTGAALFVFSRRAPAVSLREITPRKTLSRTAKTRIPLPRKHKNRRGAPLGGGMAENIRHTFFLCLLRGSIFHLHLMPSPRDSTPLPAARVSRGVQGRPVRPVSRQSPLAGRTLTPPLSRRDTDRGA